MADVAEPFDSRLDLTDAGQWLQVSVLRVPAGKIVGPHIHVPRERTEEMAAPITQECWIVVHGELRVRLFDLDHRLLDRRALGPGSILVTFNGGHALEGSAQGALMIECKNGPYGGRDYTSFEPM